MVALGTFVVAVTSEGWAQNLGANVTPNAGGANAGNPNFGAMTGTPLANGPTANFGVGNGTSSVSANGIWPYGMAPNATESNNVSTARPAPPVPNPAVIPNFNANVNPNMNFAPSTNLNANRGANFNAGPNQLNQGGPWLFYLSPRGATGRVNNNYRSQVPARYNSYAGRTFARGNPNYFGIQRIYSSGQRRLAWNSTDGRR